METRAYEYDIFHKVISIKREVEAIKSALGEDEFASSVLASISNELGHSGHVHSDSSIRERFLRVEKMAKRTAMVGKGDGLLRYLLSYLQSLFILDPSTHELPSKV